MLRSYDSMVGMLVLATASQMNLYIGGCKRSASSEHEASGRPKVSSTDDGFLDDALSPRATLERMRQNCRDGRLDLIEPHLLPEQQGPVIELIQSVDRLRWANDVLQDAVTRQFGPATARAFDRSDVVNALGVFSRDVEFLDEEVNGEAATVTIQIAGRLPFDEVALERSTDRWVLHTDPPIPGVAEALRDLAGVLVDTARILDERPMTLEELRRELAAREAAVGRRIKALTEDRPAPD
jgi:hypothetical protein